MHATASVAHGTHESPAASSVWEAPASAEEFDRLEGATDGSVVKGAVAALGIEAAMVLMAYGIWHIWHLIR
jgi:hypothetical protein